MSNCFNDHMGINKENMCKSGNTKNDDIHKTKDRTRSSKDKLAVFECISEE